MSRIHEALKKAEQHRHPDGSPELQPTVPEVALPPLAASLADMAAPLSAPEASYGPLTYDALSARVQASRWNPNLKTMLFFGNNGHTVHSESFRTLRSRLYQVRERQALQSVLITSALPAEGKTFVSANLAQAIARQKGRRVLLIDADLRRAGLHNVLGASATPGFSEYLRGDRDEVSVLQRGPLENLFFIPGGKPDANPAELISNGRLKTLLQRMAPLFDWIVFDSPPAVPVSDASLLAGVCDGIVLVVRAGETPVEMAQKARQEFADKPVVGVVLNRADEKSPYTNYYYYYEGGPKNARPKG
ncbi:MAG: polysaccharide biosynthesis tyrosine autokinase [Acidobacteria bacterium]|nr:polysaccharide biosynthesis tyrosine autokinase [Acidobacteriota bacterium]